MKEGRADIKKEARQLEIYSFIFYFLSSLAFFIHRPLIDEESNERDER